jgi:mono/diheme cytochrome c family protein
VIQRILLVLFATALAAPFALAQTEGPLPPGPGVELVYAKCQQCHPLRQVVASDGLPPFLWGDTISLMKQLGMQVTEEEEQILLDYFSTYMGPGDPPPPPDDWVAAQSAAQADGAAVFEANCAACHGADGAGVPGAFPPLAQHAADLAAADRDYPLLTLLYGVNGEIVVDGTAYDGAMPSWQQLSDAEIAAVLNHVTAAWDEAGVLGDDFAPYAADEVASARGRELSAADVRERRPDVP